MARRLRGLLLGHGHMGRHHARHLAAMEDVDLTIVDPPQGLGGAVDLGVDFAVIAAPTALRGHAERRLAKLGRPLVLAAAAAAAAAGGRHRHSCSLCGQCGESTL